MSTATKAKHALNAVMYEDNAPGASDVGMTYAEDLAELVDGVRTRGSHPLSRPTPRRPHSDRCRARRPPY